MPQTTPKTDRIMTQHPQGKKGVNLRRRKYEAMRAALLETIPSSAEGIELKALAAAVKPRLSETAFPGGKSITWYVMTVKQDLEARGEIEQIPSARPQRLRRVGPVAQNVEARV